MTTPKKRTFRDRSIGVARHHPDGGTLFILPLDMKKSAEMNDEIEALNYELADGELDAARKQLSIKTDISDDRARVLAVRAGLQLAPKLGDDGKPVPKPWLFDSDYIAAKVAIVRRFCVQKAEDFATEEGAELVMSEEMIESVLSERSERIIEKDVPVLKWDETEKKWLTQRDEAGHVLKEKATGPANEPGFEWALHEALTLGASRGVAEEKNS
jgi:hypothetical protein